MNYCQFLYYTSCMATTENAYFLRSFLLLIEGGSYITRHILEREIERKSGEGDLNKLLRSCENKLKHNFHRNQYNKLFPQNDIIDIYKWDLQLSVGVLIIVFGRTLTLTEKQKLRTLRDIRNEIYMHCSSASLDQKQYEDVREELEDAITFLAATFDTHVKEKCSRLISEFCTWPLDGVKPSLATLNGLSQVCKKQIKVDVNVDLVIGGPSDDWTNLCERILDVILNKSDSVEREGDDFAEIEKRVEKLLNFVLENKNVVFKGSKMECVVLHFECGSYEDFLKFVEIFDKQELQDHLDRISEALIKYSKKGSAVHILCRVRTESLQLALMNVIKMGNFEKEIANTEDDMYNKESKHSLRLELECTSKEGLLHTLSSFKKEEFSEHLTSIADALSGHVNHPITLKASLNVKDVMKTVEESAAEIENIDIANRLVNMQPILIEELYVENISNHLRDRGFLSLSDLEDVRTQKKKRSERVDTMLKKVLKGPIKMPSEFLTALRLHGYECLADVVENSTVSFEELVVANDIVYMKERLVKEYPFLEYCSIRIAHGLHERGFLSFSELRDERAQRTSSETSDMLLEKVMKGHTELEEEFMTALRHLKFERFEADLERLTLTAADLFDDIGILHLRTILVTQYPILKDKHFVDEIDDSLFCGAFSSFYEHSQGSSFDKLDALLKRVVQGPMGMKRQFMRHLTWGDLEYGLRCARGGIYSAVSDTDIFDGTGIINSRVRLAERYPLLAEECYVEEIAAHFYYRRFLTSSGLKDVRSQETKTDTLDMLLQKIAKGHVGMKIQFIRILRKNTYGHFSRDVENLTVSDADLDDIKMLNSEKHLVERYPLLKEKFLLEDYADYLYDRGFLSFSELEDVSSNMAHNATVHWLLQKIVKGPMGMKIEFVKALRRKTYGHFSRDLENLTFSDSYLLDDINILNSRRHLVRRYPFLARTSLVQEIAHYLDIGNYLSFYEQMDVRFPMTSNDTLEILLQKVVNGPMRTKKEFVKTLRKYTYGYFSTDVENLRVSDSDLLDDREHVKLRLCLVKHYTSLKEELNIEDIANYFQDKGFLSSNELKEVHSQIKRSKRVDIFLKKVLNGSVKMLEEFIRALTIHGYGYLTEALENLKETDTNCLMDFSELEQSSVLKSRRPDSDKPRIKFSESSGQILIENLSPSVIENISDHLLTRLLISTTEHTDILFPPFATKTQSVFLKTLEKCSVDVYKDLCELLNSFGLSNLVKKLDESFQSDEPSKPDFENSLALSREMKLKAELGTEEQSTSKLDDSFSEMKVEAEPLKAKGSATKQVDSVSEIKEEAEPLKAWKLTSKLDDSFSEMKLEEGHGKLEGLKVKLDESFQDKDSEEQK